MTYNDSYELHLAAAVTRARIVRDLIREDLITFASRYGRSSLSLAIAEREAKAELITALEALAAYRLHSFHGINEEVCA